ncbi:RodZ domain-containing protein [Limnohabitans sp. Jir72]|uniref:RodZ domain-containing protein n=1 Tax=Limnohabitans sp. Jir72 TaxID=1977909 RepID=UPI000D361819|nr:RodZ domain-containing protein [Limnohabitans sp. Jir72]PUE35616.1 hypothetical protein B9Z52_00010 [Limnohabitans sp. Jir72]
MSFEKSNRISGELLRNLREAKSMEISAIARRVNLSVAQLRQLESDRLAPGEKALFYSEAIKANAAKKVARALGADLDALVAAQDSATATATATTNDVHDKQVMEDLAQLLQKQARAQQVGQGRAFFRVKWLWPVLALCVVTALLWSFQKSLFEFEWHIAAPATPPVSDALTVPAVVPVSEAAATVDLPVLAMSEVTSVSPAEALCTLEVTTAPLKASAPNKAGKVVYLVANVDTSVCVQDASGKKIAVNLKAQESRSFFGAPPWKLHVGETAALQLFFQGQRMRWPEGGQKSFTLEEVPGAY